jgi:hypothetical protein
MHLPNTGANYYMPLLNYYLLQSADYSFTFSEFTLKILLLKPGIAG